VSQTTTSPATKSVCGVLDSDRACSIPFTAYPVTSKMNKASFSQPKAIGPLEPAIQLKTL
jgi:hypothetical protein